MNKLATTDFPAATVHAAPLYSQLSNAFRDLIRQGKWAVGSALPSEAELARRYGVSVGTARKALEALDESGWITRRQGRGTFVSDPAENQIDRFCRIFLKSNGASLFGVCNSSMLAQEKVQATPEEAQALGLPRTAFVVRLKRIFDRQGAPVMIEHQVLCADLVPDLEMRENLPVNLYGVFLRDYGLVIHRCAERMVATAADPDIGSALKIAPGTPVLHTRHTFEDVDGRGIGLVERWLETANVEYRVALD